MDAPGDGAVAGGGDVVIQVEEADVGSRGAGELFGVLPAPVAVVARERLPQVAVDIELATLRLEADVLHRWREILEPRVLPGRGGDTLLDARLQIGDGHAREQPDAETRHALAGDGAGPVPPR